MTVYHAVDGRSLIAIFVIGASWILLRFILQKDR